MANKLIVKGSTISDVVIAQENGISERLNFTSSFSFIAETDCEEVSSDTRVSIMPTGLFYELTSDGRMLSAEIHGVCQMAAYTRHSLRYLSDAYSNFCSCEPEWSEMMVYLEPKNNIQRETVTVSLPARSQIAQIRFATAAIRTVGKNGQVPMSVSACVLYENGTMDWLKKQITATLPLKEMEQLTGVRAADLYTAANGTEAELRIALDGDVREERAESIRRVSAVELDREQRCCRVLPSVTVVRAEGQLWDLAREHGSTVALIQAYNQLEEETVAPNTLLLIPKQSQ